MRNASIVRLYATRCLLPLLGVAMLFGACADETSTTDQGRAESVSDEASPSAGSDSSSEAESVALKIRVEDRTQDGISTQPEIWVRGTGSWFPDLEFGVDGTTIEGLDLGSTVEFYFYPLGRDEPEIVVPVAITENLCPPGCDIDTLYFDIFDDRVETGGAGTGDTVHQF